MTAPRPAPYKGLRMFEDSELDVPFFFGRERERGLVEANLMASRLTVLYGETGVGKSSLLRAGVAHHLREIAQASLRDHGDPELAVVVFDAWRDDPVDALRRACTEEVTRALGGKVAPRDDGAPLAEALRVWQQLLGGDLYIVLDQVEEYFLYHQDEDGPGTFAAEFPVVVTSPDLRVNFLLAIREDAVAKLDAFKPRIPNVLGNYLRLEHLDRDAGRAAIVGPIARYNELVGADERVELEPELADAVLEQVVTGKVVVGHGGRGAIEGEEPTGRIETPYLQLVMQRLWDEEQSTGSRQLRVATLRELGGAEQIVGDHVARALTALTPDQQDLAATMFDYLVTPSGTKIAHEVADLERYAGAPHPDVVSVLDRLSDDRIVRPVSNGSVDGARYEIFHDVLAQPVLAWKATHDSGRELERQRTEAERRHRRLLGIVAVGAVALVVMAGVTIVAITQRSKARSQADIARASQLAALSVSQLQIDPQRSLALAVTAARRKPTSESEDVLRQALLAARERAILPSGRAVTAASFSGDGSRVLTASADGTVRIWRRDGTPIRTLSLRGPVTAAHFSPDDRLVLATSADGTARIWHADGRLVASLKHGGPVTDGSFSRDGTVVVTTSKDGTVRLWRAATGAPVRVLHLPGPVWSGSLSSDGELLVTIGSNRDGTNRRARVYTLPSGHLLHELAARRVRTASFSPDGRLVLTGGADHQAALWEAATGKLVYPLGKHLGVVTDSVFAPGGRLAATTSTDGATRVWSVRTGTRVALLLGHVNAVNHAAFSADGNLLVTASNDGTARVWEAATGRPQFTLRGHADNEPVFDASFSLDGRAVVTASNDGTARVWDASTAPQLRVVARSGKGAVRAASFSPDGRSILVAGDDGKAKIVVGGKVVRTLPHPAPVTSAIFDRDGGRVFTADELRTVRIWRADTGTLVKAVRDFSRGPLSVSSDGRLLAALTAGRIRIVDAATFAAVQELRRGGPFASASFSPEGSLIATAGLDGVARIWDARSGALIHSYPGHRRALTDAQFSPDGKLLVTSSRDHEARVWQVDTGAVTILHGHSGTVYRASFSPDDRFVVTAGPRTAGVWVVASGHRLTYLRGHMRRLTSASFAPDGWSILTSSRDGTARIFNCQLCRPVEDLLALAEARLSGLADPLTPTARLRYVPADTVTYATR